MRNAYIIFVGKPEGKGPLGRRRRRWEVNIKLDLRDIGCKVVAWRYLAQDRDRWWVLVNTVMSLLVLLKVGNFLTS
jgi:hypothetical protein